ncbi:MAG: hypothetical protein IJY52_01770, partial [Anaerotignum sp.]|nr:hypothetical protein [Anaerotignum sp.]
MGKKKTRGKTSGMKIPRIKAPKAVMQVSNKTLTAVVCVLAVVCLIAGGIYIDTFHGNGMFKTFLSKMGQNEASSTEEAA